MPDAKDDAKVERLIARAWNNEPDLVYAILDGARDPQIAGMVTASGLPHCCLFSGDLGKELAEAAPYLVLLKRDAAATRRILTLGWGKSWGILLASPTSLEQLRRHFRRFLRVEDERGKRMYFRYYDPRVLRVYLPTCNEGELRAIFGPVTRYVVEAAEPDHLLEYRRAGRELALADVAWAGDEQDAVRRGAPLSP